MKIIIWGANSDFLVPSVGWQGLSSRAFSTQPP